MMHRILAQFDAGMIGQFHPVILHFPIVLFFMALLMDIVNSFGKTKALYLGHWLVIAGWFTCIPTVITGLAASEAFDPNDPLIAEHRFWGYTTMIYASSYAGLRISVMIWQLPLRPVYYLVLSVLLVALVSLTSDYGGLITRGSTPFGSVNTTKITAFAGHHGDKTPQPMPLGDMSKKLERNISVDDVIPIFNDNDCAHCHAKHFPEGRPRHFFDGTPEQAFLERNADGSLKDFTNSNFYRTVIVENRMPKDHHGKVIGLTSGERLILLKWLQNGAPMD